MHIRETLLSGPLGFGAAPLGNMFRIAQLDDSLDALKNLEFSAEELKEIDQFARKAASISGATSLCRRHATWNARCAS